MVIYLKVNLTLSLDTSCIDELNMRRGDVSASAFVNRILLSEFGLDKKQVKRND